MYSLRKKLTRNLIVNMLFVMLTLLILLYFSTRHILIDYVSTRLQHDSDSLITAIRIDAWGNWQVDPRRVSTIYNRVKSGHYYQIKANNREATSRSLFDTDPPNLQAMDAGSYQIIDGPFDETWLVWYHQVSKGGFEFDIWVSEDISPIQQGLLRYTMYALLLVLFTTAALIYLQQQTLRKSFLVFEELRRNLEKVRLHQIESSGIEPPQEIMPLIEEIERLVNTLKNRIDRTRHSIGNLAHELKRPIQLLTLEAEEKTPKFIKPLQTIEEIVNRELKRAKISGSKSSAEDFNPGIEFIDLISVIGKLYPDIRIIASVPTQTQKLRLDRDDMLELIGNLMDNSCKFANNQVRAGFAILDANIELYFEDDGPGLNNDQIEQIKQRGVRLDESKAGHGMGLSICQEIIDSYQGKLEYSDSDLGGLKVKVCIPLLVGVAAA
jgi:signal transduction histidine kinase